MVSRRLPATIAIAVASTVIAVGAMAPAGPAQAARSDPRAVAAKPSGYTITTNGPLSLTNGLTGVISGCPKGTVDVGGGDFVASSSVLVTVHDTYPDAHDYFVSINNPNRSNVNVTVYAVCAAKPLAYHLAQGGEQVVGLGLQQTIHVNCPSGKPLGGGPLVAANGGSLLQTVNSSYPTATGWQDRVSNIDIAEVDAWPRIVCGTVAKYHVVIGPSFPNPAGAQSASAALCGTGVPIGGGAKSSSTSTQVALNSSYPVSGGWQTYEDNNSTTDAQVSTYVVCSG